jgi:nucleotide-binding universal stress UspA family protein
MTYQNSPDDWIVGQSGRRRRIVHANDGSESSFRALAKAFGLAERSHSALRIILVADSLPPAESIFDAELQYRRAGRRLERMKRRVDSVAARFSVPYRTYSFTGHPVKHVLQFVKEARADLLVIGATRACGLFDLAFGSRSERIARRAVCSVLIVR